MGTRLEAYNYTQHLGMDARTSKIVLQDTQLQLAQNVTFREIGALTKRSGYNQINNSQPQN